MPKKRAFLFSDSLNQNSKIEILRDLRVSPIKGGLLKLDDHWVSGKATQNLDIVPMTSWKALGNMHISQKTETMKKLDNTLYSVISRGKGIIKLIEQDFKKYNEIYFVKAKTHNKDINKLTLNESMKVYEFNKLFENILTESELVRFIKEKEEIFTNIQNKPLPVISYELSNFVERYYSKGNLNLELKKKLYAHFLISCSYFASLDLSSVKFKPTFLDFFYFSIITATTTGYGDITPNNLTTRLLTAFQIIITYILLGYLIHFLTTSKRKKD